MSRNLREPSNPLGVGMITCLLTAILLAVCLVVWAGDENFKGPSGPITRMDLQLVGIPSQFGAFTHARYFAAEEWRTDTPDRAGLVIYAFNDGAYRVFSASGGKFYDTNNRLVGGSPKRWAFIATAPAQWDGKGWVFDGKPIEDRTDGTVTDELQARVDNLLRFHTWQSVMNAADKSPYRTEPRGEPE